MARANRLTPEMRQESISRSQLTECFIAHGWIYAEPKPDLGEDFIFSIYFDGQATGVNFYVQLKSVADIANGRHGDFLSYRFDVKDLVHWEGFAYPVVLVVWDVNLRAGRWILERAAAAKLDHSNPAWRSQLTATVSIPWGNTTDHVGLERLRVEIGQDVWPMLLKGSDLTARFTFNVGDTPEGERTREALGRMVDEGEGAVFEGEAIVDIDLCQKLKAWMPSLDAESVMISFGPRASDAPHVADLELVGRGGTKASFKRVDLRITNAGSRYILLSNAHESSAIRLQLRVDRTEGRAEATVSIEDGRYGYNITETLDALRLCRAVQEGARLTLTFIEFPEKPLSIVVPPSPAMAQDPHFVWQVESLCRIQDAFGIRVRIPDSGISETDAQSIAALASIIDSGRVEAQLGLVTLRINRVGLERIAESLRSGQRTWGIELKVPNNTIRLFDQDIQTGPLTRQVTGELHLTVGEIDDLIERTPAGATAEMEWRGLGIEEYDDWPLAPN